ncbi:MAG TPA: tripartite tricarboxylate transporter substrate-binding protein [Alphaproteobacteria bacterium]|nr:tripartite tricarboxylate transporter substrate-binding protein [Alphaproteobacteria bacterium]
MHQVMKAGAATLAALLSCAAGSAAAQDNYYAGKRMSVVIGYAAGGTADTDGRLVAQFLGKHIPGHPTIIAQNQPGAGGLASINTAYNIAQPDGLNIYQLGSGHYLQQLAGSSVVKFDLSKMPVLGSWTRSTYALVVRADKFKSIEDIRKSATPPAIGTQGLGTGTYLFSLVWQNALGIKLNMVNGYESAEQDLAIERGEIDGRTNTTESITRARPQWLSSGFAKVLAVSGTERDPLIPDAPTVGELVKDPGALFETINEGLSAARPYVLPPKTPPERVATLRKAWNDMLGDQDFIAELEKRKFKFIPVKGEELEAFYRRVVADTPPDVIDILKANFK